GFLDRARSQLRSMPWRSWRASGEVAPHHAYAVALRWSEGSLELGQLAGYISDRDGADARFIRSPRGQRVSARSTPRDRGRNLDAREVTLRKACPAPRRALPTRRARGRGDRCLPHAAGIPGRLDVGLALDQRAPAATAGILSEQATDHGALMEQS